MKPEILWGSKSTSKLVATTAQSKLLIKGDNSRLSQSRMLSQDEPSLLNAHSFWTRVSTSFRNLFKKVLVSLFLSFLQVISVRVN